jgi:hypothetical protein
MRLLNVITVCVIVLSVSLSQSLACQPVESTKCIVNGTVDSSTFQLTAVKDSLVVSQNANYAQYAGNNQQCMDALKNFVCSNNFLTCNAYGLSRKICKSVCDKVLMNCQGVQGLENWQCSAEDYSYSTQECTSNVFSEYTFKPSSPIVVINYNQSNIQFDITMQKNINNPQMIHYLSFDKLVYNTSGNQMLNITTAGNSSIGVLLSTTRFTTTYRVSVPWSSQSIHRTLMDNNVMSLQSKLWLYYVTNASDASFVEYSVSKVFYSQLRSISFISMSTIDNLVVIAQIKLNRYVLDNDGNVRVEALLSLNSTDTRLQSISYINSTNDAGLSIEYSQIAGSTLPSYVVTLIPVGPTSSIIGQYVIKATVVTGPTVSELYLSFMISYENINQQPPTNFTMEADIAIRKSLTGVSQGTFGYGQTPFIVTALKPSVPQLSSGQQLQVANAYLCCMANNAQMPPYNPSIGAYGCTVYNMQTMDYWTQLIESGVAKTLSTQLYTPNTRSAAFSFNINPLTDEQRTCYLHVVTAVTGAMRRSITNDGDVKFVSFAIAQKTDDQFTSTASSKVGHITVMIVMLFIALC